MDATHYNIIATEVEKNIIRVGVAGYITSQRRQRIKTISLGQTAMTQALTEEIAKAETLLRYLDTELTPVSPSTVKNK